jgi:hypothetical protein
MTTNLVRAKPQGFAMSAIALTLGMAFAGTTADFVAVTCP